jgi:hypothetical protein
MGRRSGALKMLSTNHCANQAEIRLSIDGIDRQVAAFIAQEQRYFKNGLEKLTTENSEDEKI